ncbi:MAG: lysine transporter LysE [Flaviaesturariibacter sp.]|nr:lysine transporter LysE [Flaviaesturariibacter sp.]
MPKLMRIFFTGMFISFLGSLPLGTLNVAAAQLAITDGIRPAFLFSLGSLTAEVVYVRLSLIAMDWVRRQQRLFRILEWVTLAIVVALAVSSFYAATHPSVHKNVILSSTLNRYLLGLTMSALNPVQIPFWFGWSTVLFTKKILLPKTNHYNIYILGIGLGTLMGNCVFVFGGKLIATKISGNQNIMNWVIGGIFTLTALIQLYKMSRKKGVEERIEHPESQTRPFEDAVDSMHQERKGSVDDK